MAQRKILIDTNAYLRLAYTIHPLLFTPFGDEEYCLYILRELNEELENPKLQSKYSWVMEMPYTQNRQYIPKISRVDDKAIRQTYGYIWEYVKTSLPGPSRVDVLYIAYAFEMQYPLVTDDQDMIRLAMVYGAKVIQTLTMARSTSSAGMLSSEPATG